eukprot:scaffold184844_cov17-Tisochrysis_lutea.AAC.1
MGASPRANDVLMCCWEPDPADPRHKLILQLRVMVVRAREGGRPGQKSITVTRHHSLLPKGGVQ